MNLQLVQWNQIGQADGYVTVQEATDWHFGQLTNVLRLRFRSTLSTDLATLSAALVSKEDNMDMKTLDQSSDVSGEITHKLQKLYTAPEFAKSASSRELSGLHNSAFAGDDRSFPIDTPANTWMSAAFFSINYDKMSKSAAERVTRNLTNAARLHGITLQVNELLHKAANNEDIINSDSGMYALSFTEDGKVINSFPIESEEQIKLAADQFLAKRSDMEFELRLKVANAIVTRAADLSMTSELPDPLLKTAGSAIGSPEAISKAWWSRSVVLGQQGRVTLSKQAERHAKAFSAADPGSLQDEESLQKVAEHLASFDEANGLTSLYGSRLEFPEEQIRIATTVQLQKTAGQVVRMTTGNIYELSDLANMPIQKIAEVLGDELASELTCPLSGKTDLEKVAALFPTLPRPDAALIDSLLSGSTVEPVLRAKQAFSVFE